MILHLDTHIVVWLYAGKRNDFPAGAATAVDRIALSPDDTPYLVVARAAERLTWTRDPFDRLITAAAAAGEHPLVTRDPVIREHYAGAVWE